MQNSRSLKEAFDLFCIRPAYKFLDLFCDWIKKKLNFSRPKFYKMVYSQLKLVSLVRFLSSVYCHSHFIICIASSAFTHSPSTIRFYPFAIHHPPPSGYGAPFVSKFFNCVMCKVDVVTEKVSPWCNVFYLDIVIIFTITSIYNRKESKSTLISMFWRDDTISTLISIYCRDETNSTLISIYYRDEIISTSISIYCRDEIISTLISIYYRDETICTLISIYRRDETISTVISIYYWDKVNYWNQLFLYGETFVGPLWRAIAWAVMIGYASNLLSRACQVSSDLSKESSADYICSLVTILVTKYG